MTPNTDSPFIPFPTPPTPVPQGATGRTAVSAGMGATEPGGPHSPGAAPAGSRAPRGRPNGCAPKVIDMLCDSIRREGLSDSAAAERQGLSTSTLSRWKQLFPEVGIKLKQARAEIRSFHFQRIMEHADRDDAKGLRASMWILERLFPGDYSPRIKDRLMYLNLQDRLRTREENEATEAELREVREREAEERAAAATTAAEAAAAAEAPAAGSAGVPPANDAVPCREAEAPNPSEEPENRVFTSESDSHNSRNSGAMEAEAASVVATGLWPVRPNASDEPGAEIDAAADGSAQTAHRAVATTGGREERFLSEDGSRNSRNSGEVAAADASVVATGLWPVPPSASEEPGAELEAAPEAVPPPPPGRTLVYTHPVADATG